MPAAAVEYAVLLFEDQAAWAEWLAQHHATARGVWVRLGRAGSQLRTVSRSAALDVALCYGWIDGQAKRFDADSWLQKFTPRGKKSVWSKRNREHIERLIASGEMQPPGLAAVEAAKSDGRWDRAYDSPATAMVPEDFQAALDEQPDANVFFETLTSRSRYAILHRIQTAVRPETRARRIAEFNAMLRRNEAPYS